MSRMLSKMNLISVVQQLPKEDIETIQGYVEMIEEENQELKEINEEHKKLNGELRKENQKYKEVIFKIKMIISARIKEYQKKIDNEIDMGSQGDHFKICRYEENIKFLKDILKEVE